MVKLKNIDLFGRPIKWRIFQEDLFTSNIGACTTLILPIIICIKFFLFYNKYTQYGFARTRIINEFQDGNYSLYNFTEFEINIMFYKFQTPEKSEFSYEDYFNIEFYYEDFSKEILFKKNLKNINCTQQKKLTLPGILCFKLHDDLKLLNVSNNLFLSQKNFGNFVDQKDIFKILVKWKKTFEEKLKNYSDIPEIHFYFNYFEFNSKNLRFYEKTLHIILKIDRILESETIINLKKISLIERLELDLLNIKIKDEEKYYFDPFSVTRSTIQRREKSTKYDQIIFSLNNKQEKYEITTLSLDDILSVMGGFIQITFSLARVIMGLLNEILGEKLFNDYCSFKIQNYDKKLNDLKLNINNQKNIIFKENSTKSKSSTERSLDIIKELKNRKKDNIMNINKWIQDNINDSIYFIDEELKNTDNRKINKFSMKNLHDKDFAKGYNKEISNSSIFKKTSCELSIIQHENINDANINIKKKQTPSQKKKSILNFK